MTTFVFVIGGITLWATILPAPEAFLWAASYRYLGALSNYRAAMLYSLGAITTYGHSGLYLEERWQLMGAIEALSGWLRFGLTAAFLFGLIKDVVNLRTDKRSADPMLSAGLMAEAPSNLDYSFQLIPFDRESGALNTQ